MTAQTPAIPTALDLSAARADEVNAIAALHVRAWQQAYRELLAADYLAALSVERRAVGWAELLKQSSSRVLLARRAGQVLGFVSHGACRDADAPAQQGEIMALYVDPPHWGVGVGHRLMQQALSELAQAGFGQVSLWVLAHNGPAIRFYERAGFQAVPGSRRHFDLGGQRVEEVAYVRPV